MPFQIENSYLPEAIKSKEYLFSFDPKLPSHDSWRLEFREKINRLEVVGKIRQMYPIYLDYLCRYLNDLHNIERTKRYWEFMIGYWLSNFLSVVYPWYRVLESEDMNYYRHVGLDRKYFRSFLTSPMSMMHFARDDFWYGMQIHTRLLECLKTPHECIHGREGFPSPVGGGEYSQSYNFFGYENLVERQSFARSEIILARLPFNRKVKYFNTFDLSTAKYPLKSRVFSDIEFEDSSFDCFIRSSIHEFLPQDIVEYYSELCDDSMKITGDPKKIFATNMMHGYCGALRFFVAERLENQSMKLIGIQHGGNYNVVDFPVNHERNISDKYITWGWINGSVDIPLGSIKLSSQMRPKKLSRGQRILLVGSDANHNRLGSPYYTCCHDYFQRQIDFLNLLSTRIRAMTCIRMNPASSSSQRDYISSCVSDAIFDQEKDIYKSFRLSALNIIDNVNTTWIESISLDIPTILLWDPSRIDFVDSFKGYYEQLEEVGIAYRKPEQVSSVVEGLFHRKNISDWWFSSDVRRVRREILEQFGKQVSSQRLWNGVLSRMLSVEP
ncbi:hypothetical protein [Pseudobacteriovorax antillogorgiicola]|uniref:hypothetical protein n=1 Tax=Pseudobacteriovorax antillogorgiicola TaxID=1513793 RepID=UPI0010446B4F|nr:hypothetical protein [Pseudobacteriovorax antillogorgiicola]